MFYIDQSLGAPFGHGAVLGPANMRTFRSKGLMLSSVQDYKVSTEVSVIVVYRWPTWSQLAI